MKNSLKNTFPLDGKTFSQPGVSNEWKKLFLLARKKQFPLGAKRLFFKNWPPRFDNGFH